MNKNIERTMIIFFSNTGTTKNIAEQVRSKIDEIIKNKYHDTSLKQVFKDIYEIKPITPYPKDYNQTLIQVQTEITRNALPYYQTLNFHLVDFDIIYLGMPVWCHSIPPIVKTFLSMNDFRNKTIIPFITSGQEPGTIIEDIAKLSKAVIQNPIILKHNSENVLENQDDYNIWLQKVGK